VNHSPGLARGLGAQDRLPLLFLFQFLSPSITVHHRQKSRWVLRRALFRRVGISLGLFLPVMNDDER